MIRAIEELALRAWPALQTTLYDGWVLRQANGYTRRANSVNPLYPSSRPLEEKVAHCEQFYRDSGLKVVFKMTAASCPEDLDYFLATRGYVVEPGASVQLLDLRNVDVPPADAVAEAVTEEWFTAYCRMSGLKAEHRATAWRLLNRIVLKTGFASLHRDGEIVACGLGVVEGSHVGLFDIVTAPQYRCQGYGRRLVQGILRWARENGAHTAYLQVMRDNAPALALYGKLGFRERYGYWYRVKV